MRKFILALVCLLAAGIAHAQQQLEIIDLKSRTAEQVLPQLRPFVEPGGTISGMNNQVFIRASEANRRQIRELLGAIDRPPRRLVISVRRQPLRAIGTLRIAGAEKEVAFDLATAVKGDRLVVTGSVDLLMTDFGIAAPKAMMGMLRTDPKVTVTFETVLSTPLT